MYNTTIIHKTNTHFPLMIDNESLPINNLSNFRNKNEMNLNEEEKRKSLNSSTNSLQSDVNSSSVNCFDKESCKSKFLCYMPNKYKTYKFADVEFNVQDRFRPLELIGRGSYGFVCSSIDKMMHSYVAIKKIKLNLKKKVCLKRNLREMKFLRILKHENIVSLQSIMQPENENFDEIFLLIDLMECDLYSIIRSPQVLTDDHCRLLLYQLLQGLKYIHSLNIVHRDIKPRNLLVDSNCNLKICDFGLARLIDQIFKNESYDMTDYVATRWYRAPEVILSWPKYEKSVDIWAVGCIFAELLGREPIFPGKNEEHQITLILSILGKPSPLYINNIKGRQSRNFINSFPESNKIPFFKIYPYANPKAWNLLDKLLEFDPEKRISAEKALEHPYFNCYQSKECQISENNIDLDEFKFEKMHYTKKQYYDLIIQEVIRFHPFNKKLKRQNYSKINRFFNMLSKLRKKK